MGESCLFIIDVQRGFINRWTEHLPARIEALQDRFARLVVTRFHNPEGSLHRRLIGWRRFAPGSAETELAFAPSPRASRLDKSTYTGLTAGLLDELRRDGVVKVHLCGIATDNCVLKTAVDLFEAGIEPVVLAEFCASHGGPECHDCGLRLLRRFLGAAQVVSGELPSAGPAQGRA